MTTNGLLTSEAANAAPDIGACIIAPRRRPVSWRSRSESNLAGHNTNLTPSGMFPIIIWTMSNPTSRREPTRKNTGSSISVWCRTLATSTSTSCQSRLSRRTRQSACPNPVAEKSIDRSILNCSACLQCGHGQQITNTAQKNLSESKNFRTSAPCPKHCPDTT